MMRSALPEISDAPVPALNGALLESRRRWREMVLLAADLAFETDRAGRFTLLEPATILGHHAAGLIGQPATSLLMGTDAGPFGCVGGAQDMRAWIAAADGTARCLSFSVAALEDGAGGIAGLRGVARDITDKVACEAETEIAIRRASLQDALLGQAASEENCASSIRTLLARLHGVLCTAGIMILNGSEREPDLGIGQAPAAALLSAARPALHAGRPLFGTGSRGEKLAVLPFADARDAAAAGLLLWRAPATNDWDAAEQAVLPIVARHLSVWVRLHAAETLLDRFSRHDPLTGLLNRGAFLNALGRQLERAVLSGAGGALLLADPRGLSAINARQGDAAGDAALRDLTRHIAEHIGPTDLAGRMDDGFALWLDGVSAGEATAHATAIRAWVAQGHARPVEDIRLGAAVLDAEAVSAEALLAQAEAALDRARGKAAGGQCIAIAVRAAVPDSPHGP